MKFKFRNLDSIRTFAFITTFLAHCFSAEQEDVRQTFWFRGLSDFRSVFSFGVPVFFVLSGYLITYLMYRELQTNDSFSIRNFYIRRVLRIWPVYLLVVFFGFVVFPAFRSILLHAANNENANLWMYLTYLSNLDQIRNGVLPFGVGLGPTWSVSVEEQFYFFWPLFFALVPGKYFVRIIVLVMLAAIGLTTYYELPSQHTVLCLIYLCTGALFASLAFYRQDLVVKLVSIPKYGFLLVLLVLLFLMRLSIYGVYREAIIVAVAGLVGYVILYQCYAGKSEFQNIPFAERLGKYTYGLYLYHSIAIFIVHTCWER